MGVAGPDKPDVSSDVPRGDCQAGMQKQGTEHWWEGGFRRQRPQST